VVSGLSQSASAQVGRFASVSDVQADQEFTLATPLAAAQADASGVTANSVLNPAAAVFYPWQWNMRLIRANAAWAAGKLGDPGVTVAILDSGIDYSVLDLNGLVDLSRSTSFVPSDDAIATAFFPTRNKITDFNGHGTNVAQQVSSKAVVFAGVTSKTTLIGVKVLGWTGSGTIGGVLQGVLWAADHGADVANMSIGDILFKSGNGRHAALMQRAFNYAHRKGTLVVVAAGNESLDLDHDRNLYKMYCDAPNVVCVSATGPDDQIVWYSNYGRSAVTVAAPGGTINDRVWAACSRTSLLVPFCQDSDEVLGLLGTSMAAPHLSGLAALLVEDIGHGKPSQIKARLQQSAEDLGQPGTDPYYGKGRISVPRALGLP
jgi:lantibiotic leader peptide-processing serine protease